MSLQIFLILTVAFSITNAEYKSYVNYKVYKVVPASDKDVQILQDLEKQGNAQFWSDIVKVNQDVKIMVAPEKQSDFEDYLKSANIEGKAVIQDVQKLVDSQLRRPKFNRINNNYDWNYYQTLEEIYDWLDKIVAEHANVAELVTIGTTAEGREIRGVKIDFKKREQSTVGMLEGGIHAREWISPATMTWVINEFLTSDNPDIRELAENIVWHIFPVVNPDGYSYTFTNNRMWRKNRNPTNSGTCSQWGISDDLSNGIDLNRNFGYMWMTVGASDNPCSEVYAGPVANSEIETRSIINYVQSLQASEDKLVYYFAFHSFSQMVLVPYSHVSGPNVLEAANYADMYEIAIRGMDKLKERNATDYLVGTSADILYEVSGSSFDWVKGVADVPIVYLFELRDLGEYGFLLPSELIVDNNKEIMDGLLEMDRVTRHLGYYHRSNASVFKISTILTFLSFVTILLTKYL